MSEIEETTAYLAPVGYGDKTCDQTIYDEFVDEVGNEPIDEHESWAGSWERSTIEAANCVLKLIRAKRGDGA